MNWTPRHPAFQHLLSALAGTAAAVYVVGGVVRDHFLARTGTQTDLDVVVPTDALAVARRVADQLGWAYYPMDPVRDVARLVFTATSDPLVCDISVMRGRSIEEDLMARDFTVNAMAFHWQGRGTVQVVDPSGGLRDLQQRLLRRVTPMSLAEDAVRLLRVIRFAVQLDFTIEEETLLQVMRLGDTVRLVTPERVREELWKMSTSARPDDAMDMLHRFGLLRPVLPEVADMDGVGQSAPHAYDVYRHTLRAVRFAVALRTWIRTGAVEENDASARAWQVGLTPWLYRLREHFLQPVAADHQRVDWLVWGTLLHDVGKPRTRTAEATPDGGERFRFFGHEELGAELAANRLDALRFSRNEITLAQAIVRNHMRPHHLHVAFGAEPISRRACFRYFRDTAARAGVPLPGVDTLLVALADYQAIFAATTPPDFELYLQHLGELLTYAFSADGLAETRRPLVDGHLIMKYFDLAPGRQVGEILDHLLEAQAAGEVTTADDAIAMAASWLAERRN